MVKRRHSDRARRLKPDELWQRFADKRPGVACERFGQAVIRACDELGRQPLLLIGDYLERRGPRAHAVVLGVAGPLERRHHARLIEMDRGATHELRLIAVYV